MTCFDHLEKALEETTDVLLRKRIRTLISDACTAYNSVLFIKDHKTAKLMFPLLNKHYEEKIQKLCSDNIELMSFALSVNNAHYKKYSLSLGMFFVCNEVGLHVWSVPQPGEILKTKKQLVTPSGTILKIGANVTLELFIHSKGHGNDLKAHVITKTGEKFVCSCRYLRRKQIHNYNNFSQLTQ